MRKEHCVYWEHDGDDPSGQPTFKDPVECKCRWQQQNVEFVDKDGRTAVSKAVVYMDREVKLGSRLWYGKLEDVDSESNPNLNEGAYEVRGQGRMPNLRATEYLYTAIL
jgi:hypothetical protein